MGPNAMGLDQLLLWDNGAITIKSRAIEKKIQASSPLDLLLYSAGLEA
jgi:hypothetical protein